MAKVTGPLHSSEARGSVGSLTYNSWRGIHTVKTRSGPATEYSDAQIEVRAITKAVALSWAARSDNEREAWNAMATSHPEIDWTGNQKRNSGFGWYVRVNYNRALLSSAYLALPPSDFPSYTIPSFMVSEAGGDYAITWDVLEPPLPPFPSIDIWVTGPLTAGRHPNIQDAHKLSIVPLGDFYYQWFPPSVGFYTFFYRYMTASGLVTPFQRYRFQVT